MYKSKRLYLSISIHEMKMKIKLCIYLSNIILLSFGAFISKFIRCNIYAGCVMFPFVISWYLHVLLQFAGKQSVDIHGPLVVWLSLADDIMAGKRALHFVFKVADRGETMKFYREILGMKVTSDLVTGFATICVLMYHMWDFAFIVSNYITWGKVIRHEWIETRW